MADTVGISKSSVSRAMIQASEAEAEVEKLLNRRFDDVDLLIIYIDGIHFGDQCVIGAVGVDDQGNKHLLGIQEGATENAAGAKDLLQNLVERGVKPGRRRLFVIDGSKALRTAINAVLEVLAWCKCVASINCETSSNASPKINRSKRSRCCALPGSSTPRRAWRSWKNWRNGWNESIRTPPTACEKAWKNASPSIGWMCRHRCTGAWPART